MLVKITTSCPNRGGGQKRDLCNLYKSFLTALIIAFAAAVLIPVRVFAEPIEFTDSNGITYTLTENADGTTYTMTVSGSGAMQDYDPISGNYSEYYSYKSQITEVVIGDDITSIGEYAFYDFSALTSVNIPEGVRSIGHSAFCNSSLKEITIPGNVQDIGLLAFADTDLTSVTISEGVTSIRNSIFVNCYALSSVNLPSTLTSIGSGVFGFCEDLAEITIPEGVEIIYRGAFSGCTALDVITYPDKAVLEDNAIPAEATQVKYSVNEGNVTVTDIIPGVVNGSPKNTITFGKINGKAADTVIYNGGLTVSGEGVGDTTTKIVTDGNGKVLKVYLGEGKTTAKLPEDITAVGDKAFANCEALQTIVIPDSVGSIGEGAFSNCKALTSIDIPDSVTAIKNNAFSECSSLTSVTIPEGVTSIGGYAFQNCSSLSVLSLPETLNTLNNCAFDGCDSLTSVTIPGGVETIGSFAFSECSSLTSVTISEGVKTIGSNAFCWCDSLVSVTLPSTLTSVRMAAFAMCESLTEITIPGGVTDIGDLAFDGCTSLDRIIYPANAVLGVDPTPTIPETATQIKYTVSGSEVTITEIILGDGKTAVTIPETIGGVTPTVTDEVKEQLKTINHDHRGGTATCIKNAECALCGNEYGDLNEHIFTNYTSDNNATCTADGTKTAKCDNCNETDTVTDTGSKTAHNYGEDGRCTICQTVDPGHHTHTGGTATCSAKAVCTVCGNEYGEFDPNNHNFANGMCTLCGAAENPDTPTIPDTPDTPAPVTNVTNYMSFMPTGFGNSYIYSYDKDLDCHIKTNSVRGGMKAREGVITVKLGRKYAGRSVTLYKGRKSTSEKVCEAVLDENGNAGFTVEAGKVFTLIVE